MERYSRITNKNQREIVLLKAKPCAWGKCRFCDYIDDNSENIPEMIRLNREVLSNVTGEFGVLEVIDSASCFELPEETLWDINKVIQKCGIKKLFFGIPIVYKIGVETFDNNFRENYLNKHADFKEPEEVAAYFDSPCLMVGIKGQTREMIARDIKILKNNFKLGTINVYTDNTTDVKKDPELIQWFAKEYGWLVEDPAVEVLFENTDFGVGD